MNSIWEKKLVELRGVGDKLGMGIDETILEVIAALNLNGVKTVGSCEGHLNRALAYPWVQIGSEKSEEINKKRERAYLLRKRIKEDGEDFSEIHKLENAADILVGESLRRVIELLIEFYEENNITEGDERLIVVEFPDGGRLQPQGAPLQIIRIAEERKNKLEQYQKEILKFGKYLKDLI
jgi:hypothetical protein